MGTIRRGYTCYMRLWANSDELTLVRWFKADDGAPPFSLDGVHPVRHRFDTLNDRRGPSLGGQPDPSRPDEGVFNKDVGEQGSGFSTKRLPRVPSSSSNSSR